MDGGRAFIELRDRLLREGISQVQALQAFRWPALQRFNWAHDYFDRIAADNHQPALRVVDDDGHDQVLALRCWRAVPISWRTFSLRTGCAAATEC